MAQPTVTPTPVREDLRTKIVEAAIATAVAAEDTDYTKGGKTVSGFDCSGFVSYVFQQVFPEFKYMTTEDISSSKLFTEVTAYRPGDLVFFPSGTVPRELQKGNKKVFENHVGIIVDHGHWISSQTSTGPDKVAMNNVWWGPRKKNTCSMAN
jgi:peptidoglycan DL-endopeptidase LytE